MPHHTAPEGLFTSVTFIKSVQGYPQTFDSLIKYRA